MSEIVIKVPWQIGKKEAVDAVTSVALKEDHKPYGNWSKKLADIVRMFRPPKGHWQAYWTVATRIFGLCYGGHTQEVAVTTGRALAEELGLGAEIGERIARAIYLNMDYILGQKSQIQMAGSAPLFEVKTVRK